MHTLAATIANKLEIDPTGRCSISSQSAPTADQRHALTVRRDALGDALRPLPVERDGLADRILEMFYCWSETRRMDAEKLAGTAAKYAELVQGVPLWALSRGCAALERGDGAWPPSAGEVLAAARKQTDAALVEKGELDRILGAEVYTRLPKGDDAIRRVREIAEKFRMGRVVEEQER